MMNFKINKEEELKRKIEYLDKFKLIDIISTYAYFYNSLERSKYSLSTFEIEILMGYIYETKNKQERNPSTKEIQEILKLLEEIAEYKKTDDDGPMYLKYAKNDFLYNKEDKSEKEIFDEYNKLFFPFKEYFLKTYSFEIQDFIKIIQNIQVEYNKRINLLELALNNLNQNEVLPEQLLDYLTNQCYTVLNFNCDTFSKDLREIIPFKHFLDKFSHDLDREKSEFQSKPILKKGDTYIACSLNVLVNYARILFEEEMPNNSDTGVRYKAHKGGYLEEETKNVLQKIMRNSKIYKDVKYSENKRAGETDLIVILDTNIIIVEIKNRKWKEKSKQGQDYFIRQDMEANLYEAYNQATRTERYIRSNETVTFRIGGTKETLKINNTGSYKIYKLGVTLENLRTYAIQYDKYNPEIGRDMVFFNINDLKEMSRYIEYQTEFIHYLSKRIQCNKYLENYYFYDELYLFSDYKFFNLDSILNPNDKIRFVDIGRQSLFDERFRTEEKRQVLKRKILPFMNFLMRRMELDETKDYTNVMMRLLEIDLYGQKYIENGIKEARRKYSIEGKEAIFFFTMEEEKDLKGLIMLVVVSKRKSQDVEKFGMLYGVTVKRKYPNYEVIICTNYMKDPEYIIDNCICVKDVNEEADKYIEKIPELKNLELFL